MANPTPETAAQRAARDLADSTILIGDVDPNPAPAGKVQESGASEDAREYGSQSAERLAREYVDDATGANTAFDNLVAAAVQAASEE